MKKLIFSAAVVTVGFTAVSAQINMESIEFGVRAGYNHTIVGGDIKDDYDVEGKSGFHIGLFTEIPVSEKLSVQPEVLYSTQMTEANKDLTFGGMTVENSAKIKTQNIYIPVLLKYYVNNGFNFQLGPQVSFHTGDDSEFTLGGQKLEEDRLDQLNASDIYNDVIFGGVIGAGYKLNNGFTVDARYNLSFSDLLDKDNDLVKTVNIGSLKNSVFSVGVGYAF